MSASRRFGPAAQQGRVVLPVCQEESDLRADLTPTPGAPRETGWSTEKISDPGNAGHSLEGNRVAYTIQATKGDQFVVCPMLSFFMEYSIPIKVESVASCASPQGVNFAPVKSIKITGKWQQGRSSVEKAVSVVLCASSSSFIVQAVEGCASLRRCSAEAWVARTADGIPLCEAQALVGRVLMLQRPSERVYVLRSPEEQLSRLLVDLSADCGVPLLAAPATHGAVAVLGCNSLVPPQVLSQLESKFSIVFSQSAETIPVAQATEAILRRLIAFGAKHALCQDTWQAVEHPYRFFQTQAASASEVLQRPSLRMPCVDVACVKATATSTKIVAELSLSTAVRLIQPLATFLTRAAKSPELAGRFRLDGSKAVFRPQTHVLPRLTPAEITHVWTEGFLPTMQLPVELQTKEAFVEYWRMIHGLRLTDADLSAFARVEFATYERQNGLVLTYPVACLWRTPWTEQPALSRQHGQNILKQVLQSLEQHSSFASHLAALQESLDPPVSLHVSIPEETLKALKPLKSQQPSQSQPMKSQHSQPMKPQQSQPMKPQHSQQSQAIRSQKSQSQTLPAVKPEASEGSRPRGKRRLILPVLQAPAKDSRRCPGWIHPSNSPAFAAHMSYIHDFNADRSGDSDACCMPRVYCACMWSVGKARHWRPNCWLHLHSKMHDRVPWFVCTSSSCFVVCLD